MLYKLEQPAFWVKRLIDSVSNTNSVRQSLTEESAILSECTVSRSYPDRVLQNFGISAIDLQNCFERTILPHLQHFYVG